MSMREFPAYIAKMEMKNYLFYGSIAQAIGSLFVERADANSRFNIVFLP
jgi:hypothetical protein